jgi:hypothetical protein
MIGMDLKSIIHLWTKAVACLAFAVSLMFFPPSASHAASGMHGEQHSIAATADHGTAAHEHGHQSLKMNHDKNDAMPVSGEDDHAGANCCSGICLSVVLTENRVILGDDSSTSRYLMPDAQTRSVVASGFLRPPQFLI